MPGVTHHRRSGKTVSRAEYDSLRARLAELEDIVHARRVIEKTKAKDYLPAELVSRMIAGEHPVRIWREHRGLTLTELANKADMPKSYLSAIENRRKPGSIDAHRALAKALGVTVDDIC
jgi:DNA-binding XRE family transcriptional regulator